MTTVIVNYPNPEPGCTCSACEWLREAARNDAREMQEVRSWSRVEPVDLVSGPKREGGFKTRKVRRPF